MIGQKLADHAHQLWKVHVNGGPPQDTGIRIPGFTQAYVLALRPDGGRLAYTTGSGSREMWVIEHFLPAAAVSHAGK